MARALANELVVSIGWEALRLTPEESEAKAADRGETDPAVALRLHEQCDGWAAGLILMVDRLQRYGELKGIEPREVVDIAGRAGGATPAAAALREKIT